MSENAKRLSPVTHKLADNTVVRERDGIVARCTCGWVSGGHFSSMGASAAMMDHQEQDGGGA